MSKLAAFDIEIVKEIPDGADWRDHRPLGISCASVAWDENPTEILTWANYSGLPLADFVGQLGGLQTRGYTLVSWNGLGFDWPILAEETGLVDLCAQLALDHVDLMFTVVAERGHYLSLDAAAKGTGVPWKLKTVTLAGGEVLFGMSGAKAPQLWAAGEYDAVIAYLEQDVKTTLDLATACEALGELYWRSRAGNWMACPVGRPLWTVRQCLAIAPPDTGWMTNPPTREQFIDWIPAELLP